MPGYTILLAPSCWSSSLSWRPRARRRPGASTRWPAARPSRVRRGASTRRSPPTVPRLALRPEWDEGWWWIGALLYESRGATRPIRPSSASWSSSRRPAGPGCCAASARSSGATTRLSIEWIQKGVALGLGGNAELQRGGRDPARARLRQDRPVRAGDPSADAALPARPRRPRARRGHRARAAEARPAAVRDPRRRGATSCRSSAGPAACIWRGAARRRARAYAERPPRTRTRPGVHYAYGVFLLRSGDEKGLAELRRAVELKPDDVLAHLEIAFELLARGDAAGARRRLEGRRAVAGAVRRARRARAARTSISASSTTGIRELETAVRLAPESPETHFALARAYAKAGRAEDAARESAASSPSSSSAGRRRPAFPATGPRAREPSRPRADRRVGVRRRLALAARTSPVAAAPPPKPVFVDVTETGRPRLAARPREGRLEPRRDDGRRRRLRRLRRRRLARRLPRVLLDRPRARRASRSATRSTATTATGRSATSPSAPASAVGGAAWGSRSPTTTATAGRTCSSPATRRARSTTTRAAAGSRR